MSDIIGITHKPFPLHIFTKKFQKLLDNVHDSTNIDRASIASTAFAIISAKIGYSMKIIRDTEKAVHPFLNIILVGASGFGKTPLLNIFMKKIREDDSLKNKLAKAAWDRLPPKERKQQKPKYSLFEVNDTTREGMRAVSTYSARGWLLLRDEASSIVTSQNMYRGGKGDDMEDTLSSYGDGSKVTIRGDTLTISNVGHSLLGGTQPEMFERYFATHEAISRGLTPRYLFTEVQRKAVEDVIDYEISNESYRFWNKLIDYCSKIPYTVFLNKLNDPTKYTLSKKAKDLYWKYYKEFYAIASNPNIPEEHKTFIAKMDVYTILKLTGILHVIHSYCVDDKVPNIIIPAKRVEEAKELVDYYLSQIKDLLKKFVSPVDPVNTYWYDLNIMALIKDMLDNTKDNRLWFSNIVHEYKDIKHLSLYSGELNETKLGFILKRYKVKTNKYGNKSYVIVQDMETVISKIDPDFFTNLNAVSLYCSRKDGKDIFKILVTLGESFGHSTLKTSLAIKSEEKLENIIANLTKFKIIEHSDIPKKYRLTTIASCYKNTIYKMDKEIKNV